MYFKVDQQKCANKPLTRSEIKTDLEGAGIIVSKDTISRALYCTGFHSRSPRKVPLLKTKHVKDRLKFVKTYEKKGMQFWEKVIWSDEMKVELLSLGVVPLQYGDAFHPRALVSYKLSMVEWMVACTGRF